MKLLMTIFSAAAVAMSAMVPVHAGLMQAPVVSPSSNIVKVQGTDYSGVPGRDWRRGARGEHARKRVVRRGDGYYWRGHRGIRHYRPGYRRHGDWWFPAAAFLGGAILGNVIGSQPRVVHRLSNAHVAWCYDRYRSYRVSDNTLQLYNGPRRQCNSPYWP